MSTVAAAVRGFDAGKKVNGRKRHVVVDTMGLLLLVLITSASVQDRDGARTLLDRVKAKANGVDFVEGVATAITRGTTSACRPARPSN